MVRHGDRIGHLRLIDPLPFAGAFGAMGIAQHRPDNGADA